MSFSFAVLVDKPRLLRKTGPSRALSRAGTETLQPDHNVVSFPALVLFPSLLV